MSANWTQYFECKKAIINGKSFKYYMYKDRCITKLPDNLPMPPTVTFYQMFYGCWKLQDITALSKWDVSNVKSMNQMFCYCQQLQDITALDNWDISNVKKKSCIFEGCVLLPSYLQTSASRVEKHIHRYNIDMYKKETNQEILALHKENAELKSRLAYLEEKLDNVMSQFSAQTKTGTE